MASKDEDIQQQIILEGNLRTIPLSPELAEVAGSVSASIMLMQIMYWQSRGTIMPGWVKKSHAEWTEELGINRKAQQRSRKLLKDRGLIEERKLGSPPTLYYRAVKKEILKQLQQLRSRKGKA